MRDTYYVTASRGRYRLGKMYVGQPGSFRSFPRTLPVGPEDITYWPSTDMLWSLTEYPGRRFVFADEAGAVRRGPCPTSSSDVAGRGWFRDARFARSSTTGTSATTGRRECERVSHVVEQLASAPGGRGGRGTSPSKPRRIGGVGVAAGSASRWRTGRDVRGARARVCRGSGSRRLGRLRGFGRAAGGCRRWGRRSVSARPCGQVGKGVSPGSSAGLSAGLSPGLVAGLVAWLVGFGFADVAGGLLAVGTAVGPAVGRPSVASLWGQRSVTASPRWRSSPAPGSSAGAVLVDPRAALVGVGAKSVGAAHAPRGGIDSEPGDVGGVEDGLPGEHESQVVPRVVVGEDRLFEPFAGAEVTAAVAEVDHRGTRGVVHVLGVADARRRPRPSRPRASWPAAAAAGRGPGPRSGCRPTCPSSVSGIAAYCEPSRTGPRTPGTTRCPRVDPLTGQVARLDLADGCQQRHGEVAVGRRQGHREGVGVHELGADALVGRRSCARAVRSTRACWRTARPGRPAAPPVRDSHGGLLQGGLRASPRAGGHRFARTAWPPNTTSSTLSASTALLVLRPIGSRTFIDRSPEYT